MNKQSKASHMNESCSDEIYLKEINRLKKVTLKYNSNSIVKQSVLHVFFILPVH